MSKLEEFPLVVEMAEDKNTIDNYVLETDKGTKRMKNRFYQQAATDRNNLVEARTEYYNGWLNNVIKELEKRFERLMPTDCTDSYSKIYDNVSSFLYMVLLNTNASDSFKLNIDYILADINESTSLESMNEKILEFIEQFKKMGIVLTIKDFNYTMFTEEYMTSFFKNHVYDSMREVFEEIYFRCPGIKIQLKMNLKYILKKYNKQISKYVNSLKLKLLKSHSIKEEDVYSKYVHLCKELGDRKSSDEYYNVKFFLEGTKKISDYLEDAPARVKNYNTFAIDGDFSKYSENDIKQFNTSIKGLYYTLKELKSYYKFEPLIKELIELYKSKASAKGEYNSKKKEIAKEEKKRGSLYKKYLKASGKGFMARKNISKQNSIILQMNQQIQKLNQLYLDFDEIDIKYKVSLLPESASIYDLLITSVSCFPFMEKWFLKEEFSNSFLKDNVDEYIKFIYYPNNDFLTKTMAFSSYDIANIIADKYRLLGLNLTNDVILNDQIDGTIETIRFIYLIQSIDNSKISIKTISNICKINEIITSKND